MRDFRSSLGITVSLIKILRVCNASNDSKMPTNVRFNFRIISAYNSKVVNVKDRDSSGIYQTLVDLYNSTSFGTFVQFVLHSAENQNCSDIASPCKIDAHIR